MLGVHVGTVREWADAGLVPSYRTPGGHRRFSSLDLYTFLKQRQQKSSTGAAPSAATEALGLVRQELHNFPLAQSDWFQHLEEDSAKQQHNRQKEFGQHLLSCVVSFVEDPTRRQALLDEGKTVAREYGRNLAQAGLSAGNAARATIHFRQLILKTILDVKLGSRTGDEEDARLFQRSSLFIDEILLAILDAYP